MVVVVEVECVVVVVVAVLRAGVHGEHDADDRAGDHDQEDATARVAPPLAAFLDDGLLLFSRGTLPRPLLGGHGATR